MQLTKREIQSDLDRVKYAAILIAQLPKDHDGRNTWLLNYDPGELGQSLRFKHRLTWDEETQAAVLPERTGEPG